MSTPDNRILGDKYRLVRQLDEGGMGSVWLAEHLSLHSPVAVKLITPEVADTDEGLQRFLREARAAASLRSPHVVQILDYGVEEGTPYIVMELLDGESLAARLARVKRLGPSETEVILRHVARAVARAHDAGIVHRDLKPANIFIIHNEDEELVKLLDFGIAKAGLDVLGASIATNTRTGAFLGTPFYVSPEQAEGVKTLDHRTDIWSMGVIAFECLLGQQPFAGDTFGSLVLSICSRPMPVPSQRGRVPAGFDAWFARACARDVDQRFQSAREASSALREVLTSSSSEGSAAALDSTAAAPDTPEPNSPFPPLQASVPAGALDSWPASKLGVTTGVVSSSATTRRRPIPMKARAGIVSALAALTLAVVLVRVGASPSTREQGAVSSAARLTTNVADVPLARVPEPASSVPPPHPAPSLAVPPVASGTSPAPLLTPTASRPMTQPVIAPVREPAPADGTSTGTQPAKPSKTARPRRTVVASSASTATRSTAPARPPEAPLRVEPAASSAEPPPAKPAVRHGVDLGI